MFEERGKFLEMMCKHEAEVKRMCSILVHDFSDIYEICLELVTRLDKRGERLTEGIRDGVVAASSIFVQCGLHNTLTPT